MAVQDRLNDRTNSKHEKNRYRTCCNICHIKCGTVFLGAIEAMVSIFVLITVIQQIMWKNETSAECSNRSFLRDCLIFQFSHFNITLIFDYIVVLMMIFILSSILLLMCGLLSDTSCLILPHLAVQGLFLLFSLGYFLLHAWSYFYGDLYVHARPFVMQSLIERMWLAAVLLVLAAFQSYLFSAVVRCSMYISGIEESRRHRESAFERCSERVRLAKENGLWRTTSWGGGFQQYKGQYDESKPKKTTKKGFRVQWNFSQNTVLEDEEVPLNQSEQTESSNPSPPQTARRTSHDSTARRTSLDSMARRTSHDSASRKITPPSPQHRKPEPCIYTNVDETRRPRTLSEVKRASSSQSHMTDEITRFHKETKSYEHGSTRRQTSEHKKENTQRQNTRTKDSGPVIVTQPTIQTTKSYKIEIRKAEYSKDIKPSGSRSPTRKSDRHQEETRHTDEHVYKVTPQTIHFKPKNTTSRPPLRSYKSVDSEESSEQHGVLKPDIKPTGHRRRSSSGLEDGKTITHHIRSHRSPEKKHENLLVKKVSISATVHP